MNYYIQGDAAKAQQIKAAFKAKGIYDGGNSFIYNNYLYFTEGGEVDYCSISGHIANIIKTHPDYKELEFPIEPKFKVGNWLYHNTCGVHPILVKEYSETLGYKVECIETSYYLQKDVVENEYHLWTIADAKDGDVLATNSIICIFKKLDKDGYYIISPCIYTVKDGLEVIDDENDSIGSCGFKPATKEDRELLFRKMKEAGYKWNVEKKELRKIQPHYDVSNFHTGMPVLVRDSEEFKWLYTIFGIYNKDNKIYPFVVVNLLGYTQCIPFNDDTKHLLGTTNMCDKRFINW